MNKIVAISVVSLVLLVTACNRQVPLDLSGEAWKLFSAPEGFSMEYPPNWKVVENMSGARVFFLAPPKDGFSNNFNFMTQPLAAAGINNLKEYDELTSKQVKDMTDGHAKLKRRKIDIQGMPASQYDYTASVRGQEMQFRQWVFIKDEAAYLFTYADRRANFASNEGKANRIMESFNLNRP